jgi:trimeric autotransporter adhesin
MKATIHLVLAVTVFLALSVGTSSAQAVNPPPDGCYPSYTTGEGCNALKNLTTGLGNSGLGWYSLFTDTTGQFNTGVGAATLALNNDDENTAVGAGALLLNASGSNNTATGAFALLYNTTGSDNTAVGDRALFQNTGFANTATGARALLNNGVGDSNTAIGTDALEANTSGAGNTAIGSVALLFNSTGDNNTAIGNFALFSNTTSPNNTAVGASALIASTGSSNTANGSLALENNTTGNANTAIGFAALALNTTGSGNIALGPNSGFNVTTASNVICIGDAVPGANIDDSCFIGNIFGQTALTGTAVFVNSNNKLGTTTSSKRFKQDIKPIDKASEALYALRPVTFRYRKEIDPSGIRQLGLVAEDVEKVNPDLVVRDKEGKPYSVRYDQVNAMLLNEFLKEHRTVQELESNGAKQEATIARLQKQIEVLTAGLQKVSAEIELNKPATHAVVNN